MWSKMVYNPAVFREYDIRGYVDKDLDSDFACRLGQALGSYAAQKGVQPKVAVVGWDCRESSPVYAKSVAEGLSSVGFDVVMIGMVPTPVVYHACFNLQVSVGVAVTGSHNPKDMNGFKLVVDRIALSGSEIQHLRKIFEAQEWSVATATAKISENFGYVSDYVEDLVQNLKPYLGSKSVKFAVDHGNGVSSVTCIPIMERLNLRPQHLFAEPDPNFPNHHPDPTVEKNLQQLKSFVTENSLDFGIAFDGDADRIGLVRKNGETVPGDLILLILATDLLRRAGSATVIADVKCSNVLFQEIQRRGGTPVMWKTGHSLIKAKMKELKAPLAGEMSGHIFVGERYYGFDDAVYVALRLIEIFTREDFDLEVFMRSLPKTYNTPEIRIDVDEGIKFKLVDALKDSFRDYDVNTTDGVRVNFEDGWALVRASNTQPAVIMRFESFSEQGLNRIREMVENLVRKQLDLLA